MFIGDLHNLQAKQPTTDLGLDKRHFETKLPSETYRCAKVADINSTLAMAVYNVKGSLTHVNAKVLHDMKQRIIGSCACTWRGNA